MSMQITTVIQKYLSVFPQEQSDLQPLLDQIERDGEAAVADRNTFTTGHLTAGVIIVSMPSREVLLIDHVVLGKRLQPGGHVELSDDSVLEAAYRECEEETGLTRDLLTYVPLSEQAPEVPFTILVEDIPPRDDKNEPAHHHYDFWYLFTITEGAPIASDDPGVANHQLVPFAEFAENPEIARHAEKVEKLLM